MTTSCTMPDCPSPSTTANRASQPTCEGHRSVVVGSSWMDDKHGAASHG